MCVSTQDVVLHTSMPFGCVVIRSFCDFTVRTIWHAVEGTVKFRGMQEPPLWTFLVQGSWTRTQMPLQPYRALSWATTPPLKACSWDRARLLCPLIGTCFHFLVSAAIQEDTYTVQWFRNSCVLSAQVLLLRHILPCPARHSLQQRNQQQRTSLLHGHASTGYQLCSRACNIWAAHKHFSFPRCSATRAQCCRYAGGSRLC